MNEPEELPQKSTDAPLTAVDYAKYLDQIVRWHDSKNESLNRDPFFPKAAAVVKDAYAGSSLAVQKIMDTAESNKQRLVLFTALGLGLLAGANEVRTAVQDSLSKPLKQPELAGKVISVDDPTTPQLTELPTPTPEPKSDK